MTTNRFHAILLAALLAALALVVTACGGSDEGSTSSSSAATDGAATTTSEPLAITLSYDWPTVDFEAVPIVVAQQKGWFAEQGVDVELIYPPDAASSAKVLATGDSDLALLTLHDARHAGLDRWAQGQANLDVRRLVDEGDAAVRARQRRPHQQGR